VKQPIDGKGPITDDTVDNILNALAEKARIKVPKGQRLTCHCFRKMFLSYSIESGIGLTAGKLMCGKAVPKADSTYIHNARLKKSFLQLQKMLRVTDVSTYAAGTDLAEHMERAIETLQKDLVGYKTSLDVSVKKTAELEKNIEQLENVMKEQEGDLVFLRNTVTGLLHVYEAFLLKTFGVRTVEEAVRTATWEKLVGKEKQ